MKENNQNNAIDRDHDDDFGSIQRPRIIRGDVIQYNIRQWFAYVPLSNVQIRNPFMD